MSLRKLKDQKVGRKAGTASPLTTKGDLYGFDTDNNRIPVGANDEVLTADSAEALGVKWAAAAGGGGGGVSGEGNPLVISGFGEDNLAASLTDSQLYRAIQGIQAQIPVVMSHPGAVIGISVASSEARTAGTATFEVFVDGVGTGLTTVLDATDTQYAYATQGGSLDTFVAGAQIDIRVTTDGAWAPTTADVEASVIVGDEGTLFAGWSPILDHKPTTDTPDDEFDSTTLDGKWTVVTGSSGTVSLLETGEVQKYDLTTRPGWLLMQAGSAANQKVELRQDFTLADGNSIITAISFAPSSDGETGIINNELWAGIVLNDNDTGYDAGEWNGVFIDVNVDGWRIIHHDGTTTHGATGRGIGDITAGPVAGVIYFRFVRTGSVVYAFWSADGSSWMALGSETRTATATNIWLFTESVAAASEPVPIVAVDWIRQGSNNLDPWSHSGLVQLDTVVTRVKTADESVTSSVTLQDDDELLFPVGVNETWIMDAYLVTDGATAGDIQVAVKGPTGVAGMFTVDGPGTGATAATDINVNNQVGAVAAAPTGLVAGTVGAGTDTLVRVHAVIRNGSTAGDAVIQWAQGTSNGTATQVLTDSYLTAVKH